MIVNFEATANQRMPDKPISIDIEHLNINAKTVPRDLALARRKIEDILQRFSFSGLPVIKDDGSQARLLYEIAASCHGDHRPTGSKFNVVQQVNPFDVNQKRRYMSILELPFTVNRFNKMFHGHFLLDKIDRVKKQTGCSFKVVGDDFGVPVLYCDPYVLVWGSVHEFSKVDEAVEMLRNEIWRHQKSCACLLR